MTVYLHSLGCDKNLVDSEIMLGLMHEAGLKSEADPAKATVIVVNTCGFIQEAVEEGIETILEHAAYKESGQCKALIVTGCMAQRYRAEISKDIPEVDVILGVTDFPRIVAEINALLNINKEAKSYNILDEELFAKRAATMPMHVAYVKISEGCNNNCTYCTIPAIRGAYRDRPFEPIIEECKRLLKGGAKELVLIAQDTAKYGTELYGKQRLHELLKEIAALDDLGWLRVMYAYPEHVYPELITTIATDDKICSYIDMPIQHCNDAVIARMGRKSSEKSLRALLSQLRDNGIAVRTTLIVGFPGETDEEFASLTRFVEEEKFEHLGAFTYSREEGTPAAKMKPQIKKSVKEARLKEIMTRQASIAQNNGQKLVGQTLKVMVDGSVGEDNGQIAYCGRSSKDAYDVDGAVFFSSPVEWMSGDWVEIKVTKAQAYDLYGELIEHE